MPKDQNMPMFSPEHPNAYGFIPSQQLITGFVLGLFCAMFSSLSILSILFLKRDQLPWAVRIWLALLLHPAHCFVGIVGIWVSFTPHKEFLLSPPCPAIVLAVLSGFWSIQLATLAVTVASTFYRLLCLIESNCRFPTNYVTTDPIERFCLDSCSCLLLALATVVLVYTLSILASLCTLVSIVMAKSNIMGEYLPTCADMSSNWDIMSRQWVGLVTFNVVIFVVIAMPFLAFCQWKEGRIQQVRDIQAPGEPQGLPVIVEVVANRPLVVARSSRAQRPAPVLRINEPTRNAEGANSKRGINGGLGLRGRPRRMEQKEETEKDDSLVTDDWRNSVGEGEETGEEELTEETTRENSVEADEKSLKEYENKDLELNSVADKVADSKTDGGIDVKSEPQTSQTSVADNQNAEQVRSPGKPDSTANNKASDPVNDIEANQRQVTGGPGSLSRDSSLSADDSHHDVGLIIGEPHVRVAVFSNQETRSERKNKPRFPFSKVDHRPLEVPVAQTARRRPSVFPYHTVLSLTGGTYIAVYGPLSCYLIFGPVGPTFAVNTTAFSIFCHLVLIKGIIDSLVYLVASHV